jgi:hypothetical protein
MAAVLRGRVSVCGYYESRLRARSVTRELRRWRRGQSLWVVDGSEFQAGANKVDGRLVLADVTAKMRLVRSSSDTKIS